MDGDEHQDIERTGSPTRGEREVAEIRAMLEQLIQAQGLAAEASARHLAPNRAYVEGLAQLPRPIGVLPRSHLGTAPGRWMNTFPRVHECVSPPAEYGSVAVCGTGRTQRMRDQLGQVVIYPYERTYGLRPHQRVSGYCGHCGGSCRAPEVTPDTAELNARFRAEAEERFRYGQVHGEITVLEEPGPPRIEPLHVPLAIGAGPEEGSPEWWAAASKDDLEPGRFDQPDVPEPERGQVCAGCGLPRPVPDASGLCRYCRLARAEGSPGPHTWVRIEPIAVPPKTTGARIWPGPEASRQEHFRRRPRASVRAVLPLYLVACALITGIGSPGWWLFMGLLAALMSYRGLRK